MERSEHRLDQSNIALQKANAQLMGCRQRLDGDKRPGERIPLENQSAMESEQMEEAWLEEGVALQGAD